MSKNKGKRKRLTIRLNEEARIILGYYKDELKADFNATIHAGLIALWSEISAIKAEDLVNAEK